MYDSPANHPALLSWEVRDRGLPVTDATVTVSVTSPSGTALVTAASATHVGGGVYAYALSSASTTAIGSYPVTWSATWSGGSATYSASS